MIVCPSESMKAALHLRFAVLVKEAWHRANQEVYEGEAWSLCSSVRVKKAWPPSELGLMDEVWYLYLVPVSLSVPKVIEASPLSFLVLVKDVVASGLSA